MKKQRLSISTTHIILLGFLVAILIGEAMLKDLKTCCNEVKILGSYEKEIKI